eukprot:2394958-Rhodomonas_salina.1
MHSPPGTESATCSALPVLTERVSVPGVSRNATRATRVQHPRRDSGPGQHCSGERKKAREGRKGVERKAAVWRREYG